MYTVRIVGISTSCVNWDTFTGIFVWKSFQGPGHHLTRMWHDSSRISLFVCTHFHVHTQCGTHSLYEILHDIHIHMCLTAHTHREREREREYDINWGAQDAWSYAP